MENIRLAFQGIWGHKMRSFLTMLGIIIGIAAIITIVSTIQGTNEQIKQNPIGSGSNVVTVQLCQGEYQYDLTYNPLPPNVRVIREETRSAIAVADLGNSYALKRGQPVIALGRPVGTDNGLAYGEVTSLGDTIALTDCRYIRVTTDIYGSSDGSGFLIDLDGRFVGIIEPAYAPEGSSTVAAVAISPVKAVIERITNNQAISYLGIHGDNVTSQLSADTGIPIGVYVTGVEAGSPADGAGLQVADVITGINEDTVNSMEAYQRLLMAKNPGDEVTLTVQRLGAEGFVPIEFTMTVGGM